MPKGKFVDLDIVKDCIKYYIKNDVSQKEAYEKYKIKKTSFYTYYKIYGEEFKKKNAKKMSGGDLEFSDVKSELTGKTTNLFSETSTIKSVNKEIKDTNNKSMKSKQVYEIPMPKSHVTPTI